MYPLQYSNIKQAVGKKHPIKVKIVLGICDDFTEDEGSYKGAII